MSFSSLDGNRSELILVWELVEADGSPWRGRGVMSWLKSLNRGSAKLDEGVFSGTKK